MRFFYVMLIFVGFDVLWWGMADKLARRTPRPKVWRKVVAISSGLALLGLVLLLTAKMLNMRAMIMPELAVIAVFLWHFLIMPAVLLPTLIIGVFPRRNPLHNEPRPSESAQRPGPLSTDIDLGVGTVAGQSLTVAARGDSSSGSLTFSRRDFFNRGLIMLPPIAAVVLTGESKKNEDELRRRDFDLPIKNLPKELDGLTIAQVTDPHLGSFITDEKVKRIIEMTNEIDADLVLQTGDLINQSLADLPDGIDLLRKLHGRYGVYSCQGNHDCIENATKFEADMLAAGQNLLLDESKVIDVRGTRLRLIAPRWWGYKDDVIAWSVARLVPPPDDLFNLLMCHHPHGFDAAAAAGIPLTLSGHTHGGQVALTQNIGVGPVMYRYWSGAYVKGDSTCVVSNGTGNWFPLRINVPCEVLKLTLRRV